MTRKQLMRAGDNEQMISAIDLLLEAGYNVSRPDLYQLKIAHVNYYPGTGTITVDPCNRLPQRGIKELLKFLKAELESGRIKFILTF